MKKYFEVLRQCALFQDMEESELTGLLSCLGAKISAVFKDQAIFTEGDPAQYMGIVLSGSAQVVRDDYYGTRSIVAVIETSQLFAETFACAGIKAIPVSVIAVCDSEIMLMDCRRILTMCSSACAFHTRLINNLLRVVANKNLLLNQKLEFTSKRTTREKLMAYLLAQAKKAENNEFLIPYNRQALADYLEVERSAMSAEISKLCKDGVIDTKRNWFKILS